MGAYKGVGWWEFIRRQACIGAVGVIREPGSNLM